MAYLSHILVAIALASLFELRGDPGRGWLGGLVALGLLLPLPHALSLGAARAALSGRWALARRIALAGAVVAPIAFGGVLWAGWAELARELEGASLLGWPGPALLLLLAPYVLLEVLAIDARVRFASLGAGRVRGLRSFQLRLFLAALLPLGAYLALSGVVGSFEPLPALLARAWDTVPLPEGETRDELVGLATRAGFRFRELFLWRTGGSVANAAIVGFTKGSRIVLMTDALLRDLSLRQVSAVFSHEMGHSVRRHALLFSIWSLALFAGLDLLLQLDRLGTVDPRLALTAGVVGWFLGFGYLSRRAELDADLFALQVTQDLDDVVRALDRVGGHGGARWKDGWRHFSVARRILFLRAAAADPQVGERVRRELRLWASASVLVLAFSAVAWIALQARDLPRQRAWVALRLGDYPAAIGLATGVADADLQRLLPILSEVGGLDGGPTPSPQELLDRARAEAQAGRWERACDLADLAGLRGMADARAAASWAAARARGDLEAARRRAGGLPPSWAPLTRLEPDPEAHPGL
jgi:Zn-dependent protease with chaperone function